MEYETKTIQYAVKVEDSSVDYVLVDDDKPMVFSKEKVIKPKPIKPTPLFVDILEISEQNTNDMAPIEDIKLVEKPVDVEKVLGNYIEIIEDPIPVENVPFILIEDAPVYKGCEGLSKVDNKKCFIRSIKKFVINRFDIDLAQELGLKPGTYRIFAQFVITKKGTINVLKIDAPHYKLENKVKGIIKKLPQFTPGMQRKVPVNVKFTLPISFKVA